MCVGQKRLKSSKILIVGAGGLGCPAAAYIAGAGIGTLGIVDGDVVESSNLHRQIAHGTSRVGMLKVDSLITYCREYEHPPSLPHGTHHLLITKRREYPANKQGSLNPLPTYIPHREHLSPENAEKIVKNYDLVLDCTDHPTSRYLISDICVLLSKPLVSASALRTDGQFIVLNTPPTPQGIVTPQAPPCYRCVFPKPPPPESVVSCGEGGILGPVVGVMGILQALEAIKIIAAGLHLSSLSPPQTSSSPDTPTMAQPTLLLFSGGVIGAPSARSVRMRTRRKDCFACGEGGASRVTLETLRGGSLDYVAFCGGVPLPIHLLDDGQRISVREYLDVKSRDGERGGKHILLDVREKDLFDIANIDGAINVPYSKIQSMARRSVGEEETTALPSWLPTDVPGDAPIYVVCRVGNDSQLVAKQLIDLGLARNGDRWIGDIKGGMRAWRDEVDNTLPFL